MEDLIFIHTFGDIQKMQMGNYTSQIAIGGRPLATPKDYSLLKEHGMEGLIRMGLHGVIDKLNNPENPELIK